MKTTPETSFLNCVLIGFALSFLLLTIVGLFNNFSMFGGLIIIGVSIVCTLGVSLVLWVPLWWLLGWIVLRLLKAKAAAPTVAMVSNNLRPLMTYIEQARSRGYSDDQIQRRLTQEGWSEAEVEAALQPTVSA
ncbi:hypothetical protein [Spirulina major]|uniref:hypothetical protein n=1 Tax=Spirulina major TaxID=270636 RepID=UPI0009322F37|nr:hypothetical protein [Spirulina major]